MTVFDRGRPAENVVGSCRDRYGLNQACEGIAVSLMAVEQVLTHLRRRAHSHPDAPPTGLWWISDREWRACIDELRRRGYQITESIVTHGDRAANEIGYTLGRRTTTSRPTAARRATSTSTAVRLSDWSTDRSPSLAT